MWTIELLDNKTMREAQYVSLSGNNRDYILGRNAKRNASGRDECEMVDIYGASDKYISKRLLVCRIGDGGDTLLCYVKNNLGSIKNNLTCEATDDKGVEKYIVHSNACMILDICEKKYTIKVYFKNNETNVSTDGVFKDRDMAKSIQAPFVVNSLLPLSDDPPLPIANKRGILDFFKDHKVGNQAHNSSVIPSSEVKIYQDSSSLDYVPSGPKKMGHEENTTGKKTRKVTKTNRNQVTKRQQKELEATNLAETLFRIKKKANEKLDSSSTEDLNNVEINTAQFTICHKQEKFEKNTKSTDRVVDYKKFRRRASHIHKIKPEEKFHSDKLRMTKYVDTNIPTFKTLKDLKVDISPKGHKVNNHKGLFLED